MGRNPSFIFLKQTSGLVSDFSHVPFKHNGPGKPAVTSQHQQMSHAAPWHIQDSPTYWLGYS